RASTVAPATATTAALRTTSFQRRGRRLQGRMRRRGCTAVCLPDRRDGQLVADAAHCLDASARPGLLELVADPGDVHVHGALQDLGLVLVVQAAQQLGA